MEFTVAKVEKDYRIFLPQPVLKCAEWISGNRRLTGWLLVGDQGRCRLLSPAVVDNDADYRSLRTAISTEHEQPEGGPLEFREEASMALVLRLQPVDVAPPGPGWRLTFPKVLAAIMRIRAKEDSVALLYSPGHVEIWSLDTLRASVSTPLSDLI
jgi:hypothetical protein